MKAILHTTYSYADAISQVVSLFNDKSRDIDEKNFIFAPEKSTLILESLLTSSKGGYFNTRVFSFGKYLKYFMPKSTVLSREGSVMAIRKIIGENEDKLKCFSTRSIGIAENLYDSIALLKSAKVSFFDLENAIKKVDGVLKDKLTDLHLIYFEYEKYLSTGFYDQSSMLSLIPSLLESDENLKNTDVYLVGFDSWTAQAREIVSTLIKKAKSVTAVLVAGENDGVYTNETVNAFTDIAKKLNAEIVVKEPIKASQKEQRAVLYGLYSERAYSSVPVKTDKVKLYECPTIKEEVEYFAKKIKKAVVENGARYLDFTIAVSDEEKYSMPIESVFKDYEIPYYFDKKKKFSSHPLASLVISLLDANRKNFSQKETLDLVKNPLFLSDKNLLDDFENIVIYKNLKFDKFFKPFSDREDILSIQKMLESSRFTANGQVKVDHLIENIHAFCQNLNVEEKLNEASKILEKTDPVYADYNKKAYSVLTEILNTAKTVLSSTQISLKDFKMLLASAFSASEITIIPSVIDAVFIGGFREVGGAKNKNLFVLGLNGNVPEIKQDIAVLSDGDISRLEELKVIIEPKVKAVNAREREIFSTALSTFDETLCLSYSLADTNGKAMKKSDSIIYLSKIFSLEEINIRNKKYFNQDFFLTEDYLTTFTAEKNFACKAGEYRDGAISDFTAPTAYLTVAKELYGDNAFAVNLLLNDNVEIATSKIVDKNLIIKNEVSVSTIEKFYSCPFKCFMENGIKVQEREIGEVKPTDSGNFIHLFTEKYANKFASGLIKSEEDSDKITLEILNEITQVEEYARFNEDEVTQNALERLYNEAKKLSKVLYYQLKNTEFKVLDAEAEFGVGKKYPPIPLKTNSGEVYVRGKIDRVDKADKYFRIVDYKTGSASVDDDEFFMGKKIQTYLYLNAFLNDDNFPAGSYYFKISDDYTSKSDETNAQLIGKTLHSNEVFLKTDTAVLNDEKSKIISGKIDKKGNIKKTNSFADEKEMNARVEYAKFVTERGASYIKDGFILATPYESKDGTKSTCDYCPFGAVCGYEKNVTKGARAHIDANTDMIIKAVENENGGEN